MASAFEYTHCLGLAQHWQRNPVLEVDACTVVGDRLLVVRQAVDAWNSIGGTDLHIGLAERGTCGARVGDGASTVAFVPSASIDDAIGLTLRRYGGTCFPILGTHGIVEADVLINADRPPPRRADQPMVCDAAQPELTPWQAQPCCEALRGATIRATILHELGHFLGLNHADDQMAMMMSTGGEGRYCSGQPWGPMPDDIAGVRGLYHRNDDFVRELSATSQRWIAPDRLFPVGQTLTRPGRAGIGQPYARLLADEPFPDAGGVIRRGCPGDLLSVQYAVANRGTVSGRYRIWWQASLDRRWSRDDVLLGVGPWHGLGREQMDVGQDSVRVSRWLDPGRVYHLLFLVEPGWGWAAERRQGDQVGVLPGTLTRLADRSCQ